MKRAMQESEVEIRKWKLKKKKKKTKKTVIPNLKRKQASVNQEIVGLKQFKKHKLLKRMLQLKQNALKLVKNQLRRKLKNKKSK